MEICRHIVSMFSKDINMKFGLNKYSVIHTIREKVINNTLYASKIQQLGVEDKYKYLGIAENSNIINDQVKNTVSWNIIVELEKS